MYVVFFVEKINLKYGANMEPARKKCGEGFL
jgi:hypothetical protein